MKDLSVNSSLSTGITPENIRKAIINGSDASILTLVLEKALGNPPVKTLASLEIPFPLPETTILLETMGTNLVPFIKTWLQGKASEEHEVTLSLLMVATAPYGKNVGSYTERVIRGVKPDVLALDISPLSLRTGMLYAFSLPSALLVPGYAEIGFPDSRQPFANETFYPGSVRDIAILRSWLGRIPLIPIGMPRAPGDSALKTADEDFRDEEMSGPNLEAAYADFDESLGKIKDPSELKDKHHNIISAIRYAVSEHMSRKWLREANYSASRILDLASFLSKNKPGARVLVILDLKHYLEIHRALSLLLQGIKEEIYTPPRKDDTASAVMVGKHSERLIEFSQEYIPETTAIHEIFRKALTDFSQQKQKEVLTQARADRLISQIADELRRHPDVRQGVSVRGTIAMREVLSGLSALYGMKRGTLEKAALITLPYRIQLKPSVHRERIEIVSEILKETLYGIDFTRKIIRITPGGKGEWFSAEEINKSLERLTQGKLGESRDPAVVSDKEQNEKLLKLLEAKGLLKRRQQEFILTKTSINQLKDNLERRYREGSIARDKYELEKIRLEAMLPQEKEALLQLSQKDIAESIMDFMDALDSQIEKAWGKDINFLRMHTYYEIKSDGATSPEKKDYFRLKALIDDLEKRGMLKVPQLGGDRTLSGSALKFLLDYLEVREPCFRELPNVINTSRGKIRERTQLIRRYSTGDVFRDISSRHTLKEIARQGKKLNDVRESDFRVYLKHHLRPQSDIVLCIDTSGSMAEKRKLTYARAIAALLAREASLRRDRVGVVAFEDMGQTTLPLTEESNGAVNDYIVALNALGATNIGDGIKCATELLFREANHNRKFIVLITDGEPTAISEKAYAQIKAKKPVNVTEESALIETRRAAARGVRVSVIHLAGEGKEKDEFVKSIARAGKGKLMVVRYGEMKG